LKKKIKLEKEGYHKIVIGSDPTVPTVVVWFEARNKVVDSDIKSETYAIALGEMIKKELQQYVDLQ
jgi:hypothetical protein